MLLQKEHFSRTPVMKNIVIQSVIIHILISMEPSSETLHVNYYPYALFS